MRLNKEAREYVWMLNWWTNFKDRKVHHETVHEFCESWGHGYVRIFSAVIRKKPNRYLEANTRPSGVYWRITDAGKKFINKYLNVHLEEILTNE
jgi:hypothetical protein